VALFGHHPNAIGVRPFSRGAVGRRDEPVLCASVTTDTEHPVDDTSSNRPSLAGNTGDTSLNGDSADSVPDLEKALQLAQVRVEIRETHSKDHQTMFVRNTLSAARKFIHPSVYGETSVGPFHKYLTASQKSQLIQTFNLINENVAKGSLDAASIAAGQALQIISDGISAGVADRTKSYPAGRFLIQLTEEITALSTTRIADESTRVTKVRRTQQETVGKTAESELAKDFASYAGRQMVASIVWFVIASILTAATVFVAFQLLGALSVVTWQSVVGHILIALPLLGFAAYCARESSRHREGSRWAGRLGVQLRSVSAYCDRLDEEDRKALLSHFGKYNSVHILLTAETISLILSRQNCGRH
jgi:hypothetical protein